MLCLLPCLTLFLGQPGEGLHFRKVAGSVDVVAYLPHAARKLIPAGTLKAADGEAWLRLRVVDPENQRLGPPALGHYERKGDTLVLRPRFPLEHGLAYRAEFGPNDKPLLTATYRLPERAAGPPPRVLKIYPTADVLPANHLKFYIYFSRPMRGGAEIFEQIAIVNAEGKELLAPWLLDELWDEDDQCLILYIHPGRIKWGVLLRELLGPVLLPDREYSLVLRAALHDAQGQSLGKDVVKKFRTVAEDRKRVELADWKLTAPAAGTRAPLTITFPKSLDHKSLGRFLAVHNIQGQRVEGATVIRKTERSWSFTPAAAWQDREYRVKVEPRLEDVAGNTPLRPFDVDLRAPLAPAQPLELPFRPGAAR